MKIKNELKGFFAKNFARFYERKVKVMLKLVIVTFSQKVTVHKFILLCIYQQRLKKLSAALNIELLLIGRLRYLISYLDYCNAPQSQTL